MMEWTEPDWCKFVSGPFKAQIYPLEDGFSPGWTLTLRIEGTGDESEFKGLAERLDAVLNPPEVSGHLLWQCELGEHTWEGTWRHQSVRETFDPPQMWRRCLVSGCGELDWKEATK